MVVSAAVPPPFGNFQISTSVSCIQPFPCHGCATSNPASNAESPFARTNVSRIESLTIKLRVVSLRTQSKGVTRHWTEMVLVCSQPPRNAFTTILPDLWRYGLHVSAGYPPLHMLPSSVPSRSERFGDGSQIEIKRFRYPVTDA